MIVRTHENWFRMLFVWDGSVLRSIVPQLVFLFFVAMFALVTDGTLFGEKIPLNTTPFTLTGLTLAIFLAFRNNASFERYIEARTLWGGALISSRALVSTVIAHVPESYPGFDRQAFVRRVIAFSTLLKHQLRHTEPPANLLARPKLHYPAVAVVHELRERLAKLVQEGAVDHTVGWTWNRQLDELMNVVGGCERIASTPIPFPYAVLLHRTVYTYCLMLPFGLVDSIGIATPLISVFLSYTLLALEAIAGQIAEPFGTSRNSLALDSIVRHIERSLLEMCGEPVPPPVSVEAHYELT
jgi:putative membrane protein